MGAKVEKTTGVASGAGKDISEVDVYLGLADEKVKVLNFVSKRVKLLKQVNLLELLADLLGPITVSFLATF